jgi:hypothetical protein
MYQSDDDLFYSDDDMYHSVDHLFHSDDREAAILEHLSKNIC